MTRPLRRARGQNPREARASRRIRLAAVAVSALAAAGMVEAGSARADAVAYLVNVTVRPGYNFANANAALAYGHGVCDKIAAGRSYAQLIGDLKADFNTPDQYQASYLIAQSANELCPAQIWKLRRSAADHVPGAASCT